MTTVAAVNKALQAAGRQERIRRGRGYFYVTGGGAESWPQSGIYANTLAPSSTESIIDEIDRLKAQANVICIGHNITVDAFEILDYPRLDPVRVILQDIRPGAGRITVECYGLAFASAFTSIGDRTIQKFVAGCTVPYLIEKMVPSDVRWPKHMREHIAQIITAAREGCINREKWNYE